MYVQSKLKSNSTQSNMILASVSQFSHAAMSDSLQPHGMSGFPVHHQHPELAKTRVHKASDAIQPSDPLLSPSSPTFNLSQNQGLFQ